MKSSSNIIPAPLQPLGNGAWHYNFNVRAIAVTDKEVLFLLFCRDVVSVYL